MKKEVKIFDSDIEYTVNYRNVKYPRLEFRTGKLHLVLPRGYKNEKKILEKHKNWIKNKNNEIRKALILSKKEKLAKRSLQELKEYVINKINHPKKKINKIYFKKMRSKWASLSSNKNLTFNVLLRYLPSNLIDYIIFHELTHLKERKHNPAFWNLIKIRYPNYQEREKQLLIYWFLIQDKIHKI
ncbi:M48 family metallopeptidase [Candidatus Woesearchaeota archaeon]|nr:M48 family metallopeptidase [Candidatus Woesearchaeota archaeon]